MNEVYIPIFGIVFSIGGPVLILVIMLAQRHKKDLKRTEIITSAAESGKSIEEIENLLKVLNTPKKASDGKNWLRLGIILTGVGIGILFMGLAMNDSEAVPGAIITGILGLSSIAVWYFTCRKRFPDHS